MAQQQPQQAIHKFVLGNKELEGKTAEFQYDKGWYSITDIVGEERNVIYKSRNAQEAYMKWNVYIGRKKERPSSAKNSDADHGSGDEFQGRVVREVEGAALEMRFASNRRNVGSNPMLSAHFLNKNSTAVFDLPGAVFICQ